MRSKRWTWTLNNYTTEEEMEIKWWSLAEKTSFVCFGKEIAPETGTPHLQGYLELATRKTLGSLKTTLGMERIHLEIAKGSLKQNLTYCGKGGDFFKSGSPMKQGKRSDLEEVRESIIDGTTELDLWDNHFGSMVRYHKAFDRYRMTLNANRPREPPKVFCIWGETGVGKSRLVHAKTTPTTLWNWGGDRWFDGYHGQDSALFDDMDGSQIHFRMLLRILDRYNMQVPIKGGFVNWCPKIIWITSNKDPKEWYPFEDTAPLIRRFTLIHEMKIGEEVPINFYLS